MSLPVLPPRPDRLDSNEVLICGNVELPQNVDLLTLKDIQELLRETAMIQEYAKRFNNNLLEDALADSQKWKSHAEQLIEELRLLSESKRHLETELDSYKKLEFEYRKKWQDLDNLITNKFSNDALKKQLRHDVINLDERSAHMISEISVNDTSLDLFLEQYVSERTDYHLRREKLATWEQQDRLRVP